jgi:hypothetical protein
MKTFFKKHRTIFLSTMVVCLLFVASPASGVGHDGMQDCAISTTCMHCAVPNSATSLVFSVLLKTDDFSPFAFAIYIPPTLQPLTPPPKA